MSNNLPNQKILEQKNSTLQGIMVYLMPISSVSIISILINVQGFIQIFLHFSLYLKTYQCWEYTCYIYVTQAPFLRQIYYIIIVSLIIILINIMIFGNSSKTDQVQFPQNPSKIDINANHFNSKTQININGIKGKRQNLQLSDYEAFLSQSAKENRNQYPSSFKLIQFSPVADNNLTNLPKLMVQPLNCTRSQLIYLSVEIIKQNPFGNKSFSHNKNLFSLVKQIADNYHSVSYHNFTHGFSLMHMFYRCFKMDKKLPSVYSDEELTYYLIAGLAHDVNHKGTNNIFQTKRKTEWAIQADNDAVLEKMHVRTFFKIMQENPECDILKFSSNAGKTKQRITRAILGTDMAKHFKSFQTIKRYRQESKINNLEEEEIRSKMVESLFHACDISNGLLPFEQSMNWGALLSYQFNQQTKEEEKLQIPVTEYLRYKTDMDFYNGQINFIGTFVLPLWKQLCFTFQGIKPLIQKGQQNIKQIEGLKQKENKDSCYMI